MKIGDIDIIKSCLGSVIVKKMHLGDTKVFPTEIDYSKEYLTFDILTPGKITVKTNGSIGSFTFEFSVNNGPWTSITSSATAGGTVDMGTFAAGDKIRVRGNNNSYANSNANYMNFENAVNGAPIEGSATYNLYGNIMSLVAGDDYATATSFTGTYNLCSTFKLSACISAENLVLPVLTLTEGCYRALFSKAILEVAPKVLPATTCAKYCYWFMFEECKFTTSPIILFEGDIPQYGFGSMFTNCTNLNLIFCMATGKSQNQATQYWVNKVASQGIFVKNPLMAERTWWQGTSGIPTNWLVQDYLPLDPTDYLKFDIRKGGNIIWKTNNASNTKKIYYSINDGIWNEITSTTAGVVIPVKSGDFVKFKGTNDQYNDNGFFGSTAEFNVSGNILSLIYGADINDKTEFPSNSSHNLEYLFQDCTRLKSAKNLDLAATVLSPYCYRGMFKGCTGLTVAPTLHSTVLADYCYSEMFEGCTSLATAPDLPATILVENCYDSMFYGCTNLNYIKCLATNISATNCTDTWVNDVASVGTFVKNPNMSSWTTGESGIPVNWIVEDAS